ncbi:LADA_0E05644g1_1 [Lachancea dasiensis]|uniref:LADA_0E05644g1_1 n=1 Tax=Lachancea dasiensis TaxID=1072105 RepID=A0A1G4JCT5_9SACH|nr:LADA_0E05644g1_1 [Lachancea dasiensis]
MSLFRTLQNQPRIITLFTHDVASKPSSLIMQQLRAGPTDKKYEIEVHTKFPTSDQLRYMSGINSTLLQSQIPTLANLMQKDSTYETFGKDLKDCVDRRLWNPSSALWVDWEKQRLGIDAESVRALLEKL